MDSTVQVKGAKELYVALSTRIPRKMEGPVLQKALSAGATVIVRQAKANVGAGGQAPKSISGTLKRAIYQMRGKRSTVFEQKRIVNIRKGKRYATGKRGSRDAFYGKWVEYGHRTGTRKTGYLRKKGRASGGFAGATKPVPAHPFMGPAFEATKVSAQDRILQKLREILDKAIAGSRF